MLSFFATAVALKFTEQQKEKMPRKKLPVKTNTEPKIWQAVQIYMGARGEALRTTKLGIPRGHEDTVKIVEYRNAVELRNNVRYTMVRVDD